MIVGQQDVHGRDYRRTAVAGARPGRPRRVRFATLAVVRIALIKTSSMGDVIHALPVVTDLVAARPGTVVDWVVEEGFADLPRLHPAVGDVVTVALRRWRRALASAATWAEIRAARARLLAGRYDLALDLQGLLKSVLVARWTGAPIAGFSRASVREPLAALAYAHRYTVDPSLHAIERLRSLAAQALDYPLTGGPHFGLAAPALALPWRPAGRYAVFLHATSRAEKQWPASHWHVLGGALAARGLAIVLPWGGEAERAQAQAIAQAVTPRGRAIVAPRLRLAECARLLADAAAVVGVDTGLTHLSAALDARTVALFAATPAWRYGPYWSPRARSLGADGVWPGPDEVLAALDALGAFERAPEASGESSGARDLPEDAGGRAAGRGHP